MLRPVGSRPPSVYWRRRLLVFASIIVLFVLIALTARAVLSDGDGSPAAKGQQPAGASTPVVNKTSPVTSSATTKRSSGATGTKTATTSTQPVTPATCTAKQLQIQAVVGKKTYRVGDQPVLTLQVTNSGPASCVQNVADSQIVLRVYNGASRVWGSHDCQIEPGTDKRTLPVGKPIGLSMVWSGLTAQPGCKQTRQRVGAGTYTLYAALSGHNGKAAQFTIS